VLQICYYLVPIPQAYHLIVDYTWQEFRDGQDRFIMLTIFTPGTVIATSIWANM